MTDLKFPDRRRFLRLVGGAVALPALPQNAKAQVYPSRPITMIVPFPPAGATDTIARIIAERMAKSLGQPVIIENVGGADGNIGVGRFARARSDGYTICLGSSDTFMINGALYSLPYDLLNDFAPISLLATSPLVLVAKKTIPAADLHELIAWLKTNSNQASVGLNFPAARLVAMRFQQQTGAQFAIVPYRAVGSLVADLLSGQIDASVGTLATYLPQVRAGNFKAHAVTGEVRTVLAPDIPTFSEMGLSVLFDSVWYGLFAPKDTPRDVISKLNAGVVEVLGDPTVRSRFAENRLESVPHEQQTPGGLAALQKAGAEKWWPVIKELAIRVE